MKIIADENIPCVEQAFSTLGEVKLLPGRAMCARDVRAADILLVRSVTRVDEHLLRDSRVRFVGSATIGFDHVDRDYLRDRGIGFATAPGSNATSAAEYVISALLVLARRKKFRLVDKTAGIIGCGNVGARVHARLTALGVDCVVNDPPLQALGGHDDFVGLDDILQADIISVHVPLTRAGTHPTFHLIDADFMRRLKPGAILINTARGAVTDNRALDELLAVRDDLSVVLDVWEGEPAINTALLQKVALGTPHIAGYSLDGKLRGTEMIYQAVCKHFNLPAHWQAADELPAGQLLVVSAPALTGSEIIRKAVLHAYDVRADDRRLRKLLSMDPAERPAYFDRLRKEYPLRREFAAITLVPEKRDPHLIGMLRGLGFDVREKS